MDNDRENRPPLPEVPGGRPPRFPDHPVNESEKAAQDTLARRIATEKAHYERGFPVAGHDFRREHEERERGR